MPDANQDTFEVTTSATTLTIRHRRTKPLPSGLTAVFEYSADLTAGSWQPIAPSPADGSLISDHATYQIIEHSIPLPNPIPQMLYLRTRYSE